MTEQLIKIGTELSIGKVENITSKAWRSRMQRPQFVLRKERKMIRTNKRIGSQVNFLYPVHGRMNVTRSVKGQVIEKGIGPNGPFLTVQESDGKIRSLSTKKIVQLS